ncbi:MAG TPA: hypothetical protein VK081_11005 [Planctomycetota bacterium]|nr:hypothetical protein [Planctomycetota bacterium]
MPKNKDLKRRVRARMQKTGESYTTARARVLAKKKTPATAARSAAATRSAPAADHAAIAGMRDEAVRAKTGRGWAEWLAELDALGASAMSHTDIARLVRERFELSGWWSQAVTVGYERIRGLRERGQRRQGAWEVNKAKTVPVPVAALYAACAPAARRRWLGSVQPTARKATANKSMRFAWPDGTLVEFNFWAKGPNKSQITVTHHKLATREAAEEARAFWAERLGALAAQLA